MERIKRCTACRREPVSAVALACGFLLCWICNASRVKARKEKHWNGWQ